MDVRVLKAFRTLLCATQGIGTSRLGAAVFWLLACAVAAPSFAADPPDLSAEVIGSTTHLVLRGDTLGTLSARYGIGAAALARDNGLKSGASLEPGTSLIVDNRHIVPRTVVQGLIINIPQRMLFLFDYGQLAAAYPATLGRPDWPTPTGSFEVAHMQTDKTWIVPPSIQAEMRREGKRVLKEVPPGPDNPLGRHWIGLSIPGYGIHGTNAPSSIYALRSHGCIRLHPDDVAALYERVNTGLSGELIYTPALLARLADGRIFAEVHADAYDKGVDAYRELQTLAAASGLTEMIDWPRVTAVVKAREGRAVEVGVGAPAVLPAPARGETP